MKNSSNPLLKLISNLLGYLLLLLIIGGLFALGKFLYFPAAKVPEKQEPAIKEKFTKKLRLEEIGAGHFHVSDQPIFTNEETAPMCLRCHGNFCHNKSAEFRSYYNMHTFFLACETCHLRKAPGDAIMFQWFDDQTGAVVKELKGKEGNYGAKIVPVKEGAVGAERLDKFPEETLALDFLKNKDTYTAEQKEKIKQQLMKHISKQPIICEECHCKNGYLNYISLGYSSARSSDLSRIEIVRMIQEYKAFRFPIMLESEKK